MHTSKEKNFEKVKTLAKKYLLARKEFIELSHQQEYEYLKGNDSIIGRIGEFIAYQYLFKNNQNPTKENLSKNNKGYDFICKGGKRVQVKIITSESKYKQNSRLGEEWDEFILIKLSLEQKVEKMGILTKEQLRIAVNDPNKKNSTMTPMVTEYMLTGGLMTLIEDLEKYI